MMMLEDEDYNESIANIIETQKVNAEYAVAVTADNFAEMFSSMDDAYMQARATDVKDISNRIIANLTGNSSGFDHVAINKLIKSLITGKPVLNIINDCLVDF